MSADQPRPARTFRPSRPRYDASRAERQSRATRLAIEALGAEEAMAFLNLQDASLGARPIDLAGESEDALGTVTASIVARRPA